MNRKVTKVTSGVTVSLGRANRLAIFGLTGLILTRQPLLFCGRPLRSNRLLMAESAPSVASEMRFDLHAADSRPRTS